jgi:dUTP pyrophosphatase
VVDIELVRLDPELPLPAPALDGDAGHDLYARVGAVIAARGGRAMIPTGIRLAIPEGHAGFIQPRSGLALRHGVTVLNSPGLVDSGYREEVAVLLINTGSETFTVARGDRIAQLVLQAVERGNFIEADDLPAPRHPLSSPPSSNG